MKPEHQRVPANLVLEISLGGSRGNVEACSRPTCAHGPRGISTAGAEVTLKHVLGDGSHVTRSRTSSAQAEVTLKQVEVYDFGVPLQEVILGESRGNVEATPWSRLQPTSDGTSLAGAQVSLKRTRASMRKGGLRATCLAGTEVMLKYYLLVDVPGPLAKFPRQNPT